MNIQMLCTYPIMSPAHGGQLRVRNLVDHYRAAGHQVSVAGVLGSEHYPSEDGFVPYPGRQALVKVLRNPDLLEDYAIQQLFSQDEVCYRQLRQQIQVTPDIIHVEQPWLFEFARRAREQDFPHARLIYGSQNIEHLLKQKILASCVGAQQAVTAAEQIEQLEIHTLSKADAVICVSDTDAAWSTQYTDQPVVVAPNGVHSWQTTDAGRQQARQLMQPYSAYALYCASGHPPNTTGFFDLLGGGFGSLSPDEKLVIAGSVGDAISSDPRLHQSARLSERMLALGQIERPLLDALLDGAHCIIIPITQGGGTNLKTAEALWAGKHIVTTTLGMRGFERFIGSPGVFIADEPAAFKRALRHVMQLPPLQLTDHQTAERSSVLWQNCLQPLNALIERLNNGTPNEH